MILYNYRKEIHQERKVKDMRKTINQEIENALTDKGYKWKNISITPRFTNYYEIKLDGKLVEVYDTRKNMFVD